MAAMTMENPRNSRIRPLSCKAGKAAAVLVPVAVASRMNTGKHTGKRPA